MGFVSTDSNALGKEAGHISKLNNFSKVILICFLRVMLLCVHVCVLSRSVVSDSLQPHGLKLVRLLCPWNFPGKNTGVGCHFVLQGIFDTGIEPAFLTLGGGFFNTELPGKPM